MAMIDLKQVNKVYQMGEVEVRALDDVNLSIESGEFAIIVGSSGAGKTTALNLIGGMDTSTSGHILVDGKDISGYATRQLTEYRRNDIGFVFQFYNLVANLTALENVELATQICPDALEPKEALSLVGLENRMDNFPSQLSGGEQQRVAIARAIAKSPKILLCDEPTGALDYVTGKRILALLEHMCRDRGMTVLVITHNNMIAPMADRVFTFKNGRVVDMRVHTNPVPVEDIEW